MERLGILGGTFDPVHIGHLAAACAARHQLELDRVLLVVAGDPWQKQGKVVAAAPDRLALVAAAIDGIEGLEVSTIEIDRGGPTFTIDTVDELAAPDRELVLIVGSDVAASLHTWQRADELRERVTLAVVDRDDAAPAATPAGWRAVGVQMPRLDVSSSDLRRRIEAGEPVDVLMPVPAVRLLRERGLYTAQ